MMGNRSYEEGIIEGLRIAASIVESEIEYPTLQKEIETGEHNDRWEVFRKYSMADLVLAVTKTVVIDTKNSISKRIKEKIAE